MTKLNIGIILGSTREGRVSPQVGAWVKELADKRGDANYTIIDIAEYKLPLLGEAGGDASGAAAWSEIIAKQDGFVFIVQEYNHSITGALKNALDYLRDEWNNKAAGIVSYGSVGGARATEHLRGILSELSSSTCSCTPSIIIIHRLRKWYRIQTSCCTSRFSKPNVRPSYSLDNCIKNNS